MKHSFTETTFEHGNVTLEVRAARKPGGDRSGRGTREAPRLLARGMAAIGMVGTFKMQTTTQMKQRNQNRYMHFVRLDEQMKFARITLKPGDNGTCWEWVVRPPQFYDLKRFEREMRRVEAHLNGDKSADELLDALGKNVPAVDVAGVTPDSLDFDIDDALERADGMIAVEDNIRDVATKLSAEVARQALLNKGLEERRRREAEQAAEQAAAKKAEQSKPVTLPPQPLKIEPAKPLSQPQHAAPSTNGEKPNLLQKLTKAHELAQPYVERRASIEAKQAELELKLQELAALEEQINTLKKLQERDTAGAEAAQLVDALSKFV